MLFAKDSVARAWVGVGNAYYQMKKIEPALAAFEQAVAIDLNDGYTRRNLGGILIGLKRSGEAVVHLRKALELMPNGKRLSDAPPNQARRADADGVG